MREISRKGLERIVQKEINPIIAAWDDASDGPELTAKNIYDGILKASRKYDISVKIAFQVYKSFCKDWGIERKISEKQNYFIYLDMTTSIENLI